MESAGLKPLVPPAWLVAAPLGCSTCGKPLSRLPIVDPWAFDLGCPADHRFFLMLGGPAEAASATAEELKVPELAGLADTEVIARWLRGEKLRPVLDNELARILARIEGKRHVAESPRFELCPIHGKPMSASFHSDPRIRGLRCPAGHDLAERIGKLWFQLDQHPVALSAELSDAALGELAERWVGPERSWQARLHPSLRAVLENFLAVPLPTRPLRK